MITILVKFLDKKYGFLAKKFLKNIINTIKELQIIKIKFIFLYLLKEKTKNESKNWKLMDNIKLFNK